MQTMNCLRSFCKKRFSFIMNRQIFNGEKPEEAPSQVEKTPQAVDEHVTAEEYEEKGRRLIEHGLQKAEALKGPENKQAFDKPMTDAEIKEIVGNYGRVSNPNDKERTIITKLKGEIMAEVKRKNADNPKGHRGNARIIDSSLTDNYEYVLVIDATRTPSELLYKSPDKSKAEAAQKEAKEKSGQEPVDADTLLNTPYKELSDTDPSFAKYLKMMKSYVKEHGDAQEYEEGNNKKYVLVKDNSSKGHNGYRVFEGALRSV